MGMVTKTLGKGAKFVGKTLYKYGTKPNEGFDALFLPQKLNLLGVGVAAVGATAVGGAGFVWKGANAAQFGKVTYDAGMARMTNAYNTGAVPAMMEASGGNYGVFADMAKHVVRGHNNFMGRAFDDYGADAKLVSALYGMGRG